MKSLSTTIIEGYMGRDTEFRVTPTGQSLARFSVAVNRPVRDATSESGWKDVADWFDCVAWERRADVAANLLRGQHVLVKGRMIQEHWEDAQGNKRVNWKLQVEELHPLGIRVIAGDGVQTAESIGAEARSGMGTGQGQPSLRGGEERDRGRGRSSKRAYTEAELDDLNPEDIPF